MLKSLRGYTEPSDVVDGRYRLGRLVHRSVAASLYDANHRNGASAWIKLAASPARVHLFDVEVALAKTHASALRVRDDGITEDGLPYLVIDSLDGRSLAQRMSARHPLGVAEVIRIGAALARAIAVLHHEGYALGALNARSVFVTEECEIMLLDFSCVSELSAKTAAVDANLMNSLVQSMLATLSENERQAAARAPELRPWHAMPRSAAFARPFIVGIACAVLAVAATCFAMNATAGTRFHGASARASENALQPVIELGDNAKALAP
jgi:hypothetical protein